MTAEIGVVPGSVMPEVPSSVVKYEVITEITPPEQHIIYDSISSDNVGIPDFQAIAKGLLARKKAEESSDHPSRADQFIPAHSFSLPLEFKEPPPYFLDACEWEIYSHRLDRINKRMEDQLRGTF